MGAGDEHGLGVLKGEPDPSAGMLHRRPDRDRRRIGLLHTDALPVLAIHPGSDDALPSGGYLFLSTVNATSHIRATEFLGCRSNSVRVPPVKNKVFIERAKEWNRTGMQQIRDDRMHVKEHASRDQVPAPAGG